MNHAPTGFFVLMVEGQPDVGETLLARPNGIKDGDGIDHTKPKTFQWFLDGEPIPGATEQTYVPTKADRGKWISCWWSYTDGKGKRETVTSKPLDSFVTEPRMENLRGLYVEYFGRDADGPGLVHWADRLVEAYERMEPEDALSDIFYRIVAAAQPDDIARMKLVDRT